MSASSSQQSHQVRIIGGQWRRTKLPVVKHPGLRPTSDRVRETLFNWLGQNLTGWYCLDAFAGSGALGFEAASRGAAQVMLLEQERKIIATLRQVQERLQAQNIQLECTDALAWMQRAAHAHIRYDVIFLDPPFDAELFERAIQVAKPLLSAQGLIYLETGRAFSTETWQALQVEVVRSARAGQVYYHLLQPGRVPTTSC